MTVIGLGGYHFSHEGEASAMHATFPASKPVAFIQFLGFGELAELFAE